MSDRPVLTATPFTPVLYDNTEDVRTPSGVYTAHCHLSGCTWAHVLGLTHDMFLQALADGAPGFDVFTVKPGDVTGYFFVTPRDFNTLRTSKKLSE